MNAAGNNEERPDDNYECRVIDSRVEDPGRLANQDVIKTDKAGEADAKLMVVPLPMMLRD